MQFTTIFRILGALLMLFSLTMLPPVFVAWLYKDGGVPSFMGAFLVTLATGFLLWLPFRHRHQDLKTRDGFWVVVSFWLVLCFFGALPFMLATHPHETLTDAVFESVSGLTTTGATMLSGIDFLPHAIRYYRQQLQFLGGMGIIVLAVAILPMLGIGGMQLYRAETPGPIKDNKLTPRITETAKALWYIYVGLTILCALAYWAAGMNLFDAIGQSFGTVSTGGFATHDASFGYYHSTTLDMVAVVFMIAGGTNFALHFLSMQHRGLGHYWADLEFKSFIYILLLISAITAAVLISADYYARPGLALIKSVFNVVSIATTTGFTSANIASWPTFIPILLMVVGIVGGCAASTSGGVKVIRLLLLNKQAMREVKRLIHPRAVISIKFGKHLLPEEVIQAMWGFISIFVALFIVLVLALMATGVDLQTAFGATVGCFANVGPGLGSVANNYEGLTLTAKWLLVFAMLAGRLEIFTLLVLFTPTFWKL